MWPTRRSRRAGERGAGGAAGALVGLGCLGAFSFFDVGWEAIGGVLLAVSAGAESAVLAATFSAMLVFRALAAFWLISSEGFVLPTTNGLSCPPDDETLLVVFGDAEGDILWISSIG